MSNAGGGRATNSSDGPSFYFVILAAASLAPIGLLTCARGLSWFGRLPGDIRHRGVHTRIYVTITSTLLLSLSTSLLAYLLRLIF